MADYEVAIRNAIKECFHSIRVEGCHFHHPQSTWRKLGKMGHWNDFKNIEGFARSFKTLNALAYIPPDEVLHCFRLLMSSPSFCQELKKFAMEYFYPVWIAGINGRFYKIEDWNVFYR